MTTQPVWKVIEKTDDSRIYVDAMGVYPPEMEVAIEGDGEIGGRRVPRMEIYRFALDRFKFVKVDWSFPPELAELVRMAAAGDPQSVEVLGDWIEEHEPAGVPRLTWQQIVEVAQDPPKPETYFVPYRWDSTWSHPVWQYREWFDGDLSSVASFVGEDEDTLRQWLADRDPRLRARAYRAIGEYHGYVNLDSDLLRLTPRQLEKRWEKQDRS